MSDQKQKAADPPADEAPYAPPPAGGDSDSRKRELKTAMAAADARGETDAVEALREDLDEVTAAQQRKAAAEARKTAAGEADDPDAVRKAPPPGRTATPAKATTKQADPGKGGPAGDEGKK